MKKKIAVIAGAGPAGLTAAFELRKRTNINPVVFEATDAIGGISRTHIYKGNRMDIGGHRFFSKVDRVMDWWFSILPPQGHPAADTEERKQKIDYATEAIIEYLLPVEKSELEKKQYETIKKDFQNIELNWKNEKFIEITKKAPNPEQEDEVMLERSRLSRIFYKNVFFPYPLVFTIMVALKMGIINTILITFSYLKAQIFPINDESTLDKFLINRFGVRLYKTFFKDYTEKVWGVPCNEIKSDWGAQRIKGLSLKKALVHAIKDLLSRDFRESLEERETTLINRFFYPKLGPGQMWETVAKRITVAGSQINMNHPITGLNIENKRVKSATFMNLETGEKDRIPCDYFFSTMPIKHLIKMIKPKPPMNIQEISEGLCYRDFITVGLLLNKLNIIEKKSAGSIGQLMSNKRIARGNIEGKTPDNWIYIQDGRVKVGRVQIFNNWSPYLVKNSKETIWIGLEYFVNKGDTIWVKPDNEMIEFGINEMEEINFLKGDDVLDGCVLRMPNTYPAYFGSYDKISEIYDYVNSIENLFLIGRNGLHKYNNQDHSMMTAMLAVDMIQNGETDKSAIFDYNIERVHHEQELSDTSL
tara:strand:- start:729 stop:2492 length:1764 start_codon:yes stop_codon:yes gene_type:complete